MPQYLVLFDLPDELIEHMKKHGEIDWGAVGPYSDEKHTEQFATSLKLTREHFKLEGDQKLHGLYVKGTETIIGHTGTSPTCGLHARIITGLWNALHHQVTNPPIGSEGALL
jgi:hypothetical protein